MSVTRLATRIAGTIALSLAAFGQAAPAQAAIAPQYDPWYAAPADIASVAPGGVIRSRTVTTHYAPGIKVPFKTYQVLYRTNDQQDQPVATAATIYIPLSRPSKTFRKLVSYQIAYDGLAGKCQPSFALQSSSNPVAVAELPLITADLLKGWTVVTADYEGPNNTWIAGRMTGHGVLDGIRAAENFPQAGLPGQSTPVGIMGYSGGGHASAWAGELASTYAPELNIKGIAAGGVPADPAALLHSLDGSPSAGVLFAAIVGLKRAYPNVNLDQYITPAGQSVFRKLGTECIGEFLLQYRGKKIAQYSTVPDILAQPEIKQIADENTLGFHKPPAPALIYHAKNDELVGYAGAPGFAKRWCDLGGTVQFVTTLHDDHATLAVRLANQARSFIAQRFSGAPAPSTCAPAAVSDQ